MTEVAGIKGQHHTLPTVYLFFKSAFKTAKDEILLFMAYSALALCFTSVRIKKHMALTALYLSYSHLVISKGLNIFSTRNTNLYPALFIKIKLVKYLTTLHAILIQFLLF
jgi:hypothetical protein